jgi:hypothetical protein
MSGLPVSHSRCSEELIVARARIETAFAAIQRFVVEENAQHGSGALHPVKSWFSTGELATFRLPGFPATREGWDVLAKREGWAQVRGKARRRAARGGGVEFHIDLLMLEMLRRLP